MNEQHDMVKVSYGVISGMIACILTLTYSFYSLFLRPDSGLGVRTLGNIKFYVIFVCIFFVVFSVCYGIMRICDIKMIGNMYINYGIGVVLIVLIGILVVPFFTNAWVFPSFFTVLYGGGVLCICIKSIHDENAEASKFNSIILILLGGLLWGIAVATSNTFSPAAISATYDVHHTSAYIDSIYNVYNLVEFHGGITDQYGHYGLFFYLPLKCFGFSTKTIAGVCAVLSSATYVFAMSSFCKIVKSHVVQYIVCIIGGAYAIYPALGNIYWQVYPHRILFPSIILFLTTKFVNSNISIRMRYMAVTILICAMLWNFETGIICCLAWAAFRGMDALQGENISKGIRRAVIRIVVIITIPILGAYCIVNIYNLFCGGINALLGMKEFVGMAIDDEYITSLCTPLIWGNKIYLHKILVFILCLSWGILHNSLFGKSGMKEKSGYAVVNGVIGLGLMTYYMNRTMAGDNIVNLFFVISLGLILDGTIKILKKEYLQTAYFYYTIKGVIGIYALMILVGCSLQTMGLYQGYVNKYDAKAYSYEDFKLFAQEISNNIPANTWAMGDGMSAIYMELGWEKGTWGFGDTQAIEIADQDAIFVSNIRYNVVPSNFKLVHEFIYFDIAFGYFVKNETQ